MGWVSGSLDIPVSYSGVWSGIAIEKSQGHLTLFRTSKRRAMPEPAHLSCSGIDLTVSCACFLGARRCDVRILFFSLMPRWWCLSVIYLRLAVLFCSSEKVGIWWAFRQIKVQVRDLDCVPSEAHMRSCSDDQATRNLYNLEVWVDFAIFCCRERFHRFYCWMVVLSKLLLIVRCRPFLIFGRLLFITAENLCSCTYILQAYLGTLGHLNRDRFCRTTLRFPWE